MSDVIAEFLKQVRLFEALPVETLATLAEQASIDTYDTDHTLFYEGDAADRVYLVREGEVAIETVSRGGRIVSLATLGHHQLFGEMAVLDDGRRSANVRTLRTSTIISFSRQVFLSLIDTQPVFARQIISDLVHRLRTTDGQIEAITLKPLKTRLAGLLSDLANAHGTRLVITQNELAERLSATREKVNVNLQALRHSGAIELGRGRVDVIDIEKLNQF